MKTSRSSGDVPFGEHGLENRKQVQVDPIQLNVIHDVREIISAN